MAAKKRAAKAGAGAVAVGKAARSNEYVQRMVDDAELRESLRDAFQSARKAYDRIANGKGPAKALMEDRKTQRELRDAANSLRQAADSLRGAKKKRRRRRRGGLLLVLLVGAGAAVMMSEKARNKLLDALFGAEEEFEYTPTNTQPAAAEPAQEKAGAS